MTNGKQKPAATAHALGRWAERRRRSAQLRVRYPHAASMLALYQDLLEVEEPAWRAALDKHIGPASLPAWTAERIAPAVAAATAAHGPHPLAVAVAERVRHGGVAAIVTCWLEGGELTPADRFLARASAGPVLEAMMADAPASPGHGDAGHCPWCGGLPQSAFVTEAGEPLVTAPRRLLCARCSHAWVHARTTCPACGESTADRLTAYSDAERFPQLQADVCQSCHGYLLTVDLRRDAGAVPEVDELAALPLDLWVQQHGFHKIVPNLMGVG